MTSPRTLAVFALMLTALLPSAASAQVVNRPQRASDIVAPPDAGSRTVQTLDLSLDLLGGHDETSTGDSAPPDPTDPSAPTILAEPTYTGTVDLGLAYRRSRGARSLSFDSHGSMNMYGGGDSAADIGPTRRFSLGVIGTTPLRRLLNLNASQRVVYDTLYSLGSFAPIAGDVTPEEIPIGGAGQSVAEIASWSSESEITVDRRLSRRNTIGATYGYVKQVYQDEDRGDNSSQRANLFYTRVLSRTSNASATYGYSSGEYALLVGGGGPRPLTGHLVEGSISYTKRISARRALQLNFGGGASRTEAVTGTELTPYSFWAPSGRVSARIDLARTWALSGNYARGSSALDGLTGEAYTSDAFGLSLGGSLIGRSDLTFTAGYATGTSGAGAEVSSDYSTFSGTVQLTIPVSRRLSTVAQYQYYKYDITGAATLPTGFPAGYDRNAVRVGLTLRLPLIGVR